MDVDEEGEQHEEEGEEEQHRREKARIKLPTLRHCKCAKGECWQTFDDATLQKFREGLARGSQRDRAIYVQGLIDGCLTTTEQDAGPRLRANIRFRGASFGVEFMWLLRRMMSGSTGIPMAPLYPTPHLNHALPFRIGFPPSRRVLVPQWAFERDRR